MRKLFPLIERGKYCEIESAHSPVDVHHRITGRVGQGSSRENVVATFNNHRYFVLHTLWQEIYTASACYFCALYDDKHSKTANLKCCIYVPKTHYNSNLLLYFWQVRHHCYQRKNFLKFALLLVNKIFYSLKL